MDIISSLFNIFIYVLMDIIPSPFNICIYVWIYMDIYI